MQDRGNGTLLAPHSFPEFAMRGSALKSHGPCKPGRHQPICLCQSHAACSAYLKLLPGREGIVQPSAAKAKSQYAGQAAFLASSLPFRDLPGMTVGQLSQQDSSTDPKRCTISSSLQHQKRNLDLAPAPSAVGHQHLPARKGRHYCPQTQREPTVYSDGRLRSTLLAELINEQNCKWI